MGVKESLQAQLTGKKAYRLHAAALQDRSEGKYEKSENKITEALALYEKAYQGGNRAADILRGYALLLMRRGFFEEARAVMLENGRNKELPIDDRFKLRVNYSICQWKLGDIDMAIEIIERAELINKNGEIYNTKGLYLVEKATQTGDFAVAETFIQEAMEYDDEDAGTLDNYGQLKLALSERAEGEERASLRKEAFAAFEKAWSIKPRQVTSAYYYALLLSEKGDREKAIQVLDPIMKIPFNAMMQLSFEEVKALRDRL